MSECAHRSGEHSHRSQTGRGAAPALAPPRPLDDRLSILAWIWWS
jgi:hypothetical protein